MFAFTLVGTRDEDDVDGVDNPVRARDIRGPGAPKAPYDGTVEMVLPELAVRRQRPALERGLVDIELIH